jgi:hypothetical protein
LILSQALTLYTTPAIYIFFDRLSERFARVRKNRAAAQTKVVSPA